MCITEFINSILCNYFNSKYYNIYYHFNEMIYDFNLTTITIDTFKKSFSKLATVYGKVIQTNQINKQVVHWKECLEYPDPPLKKPKIIDLYQEMYRQTIYHNLTYDHGICLLN